MKLKFYYKKNILTFFSLLSLFFLSGFFIQSYAADSYNEKQLISVMPLNITADAKEQKAIRNSVEKFLLQRLNNRKFLANTSEKLIGLTSDELNKIYTSLDLKNIDERINKGDGKSYICGGNVVVLGTSVITDFFLYSIESGTKVVEYSSSGENIGNVLTSADAFTKKVITAFSKEPVDNSAENLKDDSTIAKTTTDDSGSQKKILIKSDKVEGDITSVTYSSFDETSKPYIVFSLAEKIVAMDIVNDKFVFKSEFFNNKNDKIIGLTSIDTNQDGTHELIVSNIKSDNRTINSYVIKWENGKFVKSLTDLKWIFSSSGVVGLNDFLYAQKHKTLKSTLDSGVFKVAFEKGQMVVPETPMTLPKSVYLPGFTNYPDSGLGYNVFFRPDSKLRVLDKQGEIFWESNDSFGGTKSYLIEINPNDKENNKRIWLSSPVKIAEVYPDNKYKEIISIQNDDATKSLFSRVKSFNEGRITILSVKELTCTVAAQSDKVSGYISGFDLKFDGQKEDPQLLYSVVQKGENIFSKKKSFVVLQNVGSFKRVD